MDRRRFIQTASTASAATLASMLPIADLHARVKAGLDKLTQIPQTYDAIVLGVGSMGAATCFQLARQGFRVLGLEQFDIPHELGSHTGQSRIIRKAYAEHPDYVPLLERAYENWKALEEETGTQVYFRTGLLYCGQSEDPFIKGVKFSSGKYQIPLQALSIEEAGRKFPQFRLPHGFERLLEPDAGLLTPERSILLYTELALRYGAFIRTREKVRSWTRDNGGFLVKTDLGDYQAKKLIVTAGPWAGSLLPGLDRHLTVTRQAMAWMQPERWDDFTLGNFPCWIIEHDGRAFYGFPILPAGQLGGPVGLKVAMHYPGGEVTLPDVVDRRSRKEDEEILVEALRQHIPGAWTATLAMKTCLYTNTPDKDFVLDFLPGYEGDVVIGAGFSGHGFKFVSAVSEVLSDLAMKGSTSLPIGFLRASRFS